MSDAATNAKKMLKGMKGKTVSFTHQASGKKVSGEYQGLKQMGGRSYAHVETGKSAHRVPPHHIHQTQSEGFQEAVEDLSNHSPKALKAILDNPEHPMHAAAKDEHARRSQNESTQMKTFDQLREELENLNEAEDSEVTSSIEKKDPDAMHMSTHGSQHVYIGGQSDRENHSYHVHDTSTGKTHHVSLDHGGKAMSHGAVKSACGSKVSAAACKAIHSDHKDELS